MIKAQSLSIKEFRGIRDLTLNFNKKNFAICGHNGTGKSGVVDAIEFALTGNISRLTGKGMGNISVKDHAPHVDSRNKPENAIVKLTAYLPSINKAATIERNVKSPNAPIILPADRDVLDAFAEAAQHQELVLSRRELILYVLSTPGDRAKDIQILLKLEPIEQLRGSLLKISNALKKSVPVLKDEKMQAHELLTKALQVPQLTPAEIIAAVNIRRTLLELAPITALTATTSLRDGMATATPLQSPPLSKQHAASDIQALKKSLCVFADPATTTAHKALADTISALDTDPQLAQAATREGFLRSAINMICEDACPVCDTVWEQTKLKAHITEKLVKFDKFSKARIALEKSILPILTQIREAENSLSIVSRHCGSIKQDVNQKRFADFSKTLSAKRNALEALTPLSASAKALQTLSEVPEGIDLAVKEFTDFVSAIPQPSEQEAAKSYLLIGQERLEAYRTISVKHKRAEDKAGFALKAYEIYATASTSILEGLYAKVAKDFADLYRFINRDDESKFQAKLTPSIGKLGFDADFYNRGFFPPGAYHSEGHQDSMGICLYLALMRHLMGKSFTFAVLDDVLMSVDIGHRREVCALLKKEFPDTQFVLTTHDPVWLKHMKTEGLLEAKSHSHFRKWTVELGPTEWDELDVWEEIKRSLDRGEIVPAASLLRNFSEYSSRESCHRLRASVEFRNDAHYQLGDLLPRATSTFRELLTAAIDSAKSWGKDADVIAITKRKDSFAALVTLSNTEQWQTNQAIHYNEWNNFSKEDFSPVAAAFEKLFACFVCETCHTNFFVLPDRGSRKTLACACTSLNLESKPKQKKNQITGQKAPRTRSKATSKSKN